MGRMRFDGRVKWQNVFGGMGKRGKICLKIIEGVGKKDMVTWKLEDKRDKKRGGMKRCVQDACLVT